MTQNRAHHLLQVAFRAARRSISIAAPTRSVQSKPEARPDRTEQLRDQIERYEGRGSPIRGIWLNVDEAKDLLAALESERQRAETAERERDEWFQDHMGACHALAEEKRRCQQLAGALRFYAERPGELGRTARNALASLPAAEGGV